MSQMHWTVHLDGESGTDVSVPMVQLPATVAVDHKVYAFGGTCDKINRSQIYVNIFNTMSLRWMKLAFVTKGNLSEIPPNRIGHTAVRIGDVIYLWGGLTHLCCSCTRIATCIYGHDCKDEFIYGDPCNVVYGFHLDSHKWFKPQTSGAVPEARFGHSACVLGNAMYVYGGFNEAMDCTGDIYRLDTDTMVWTVINTTGLPSANHSATFVGTKMIVLGGYGAPGGHYHPNTIRVFDAQNNVWLSSTPPAQCPEKVNRFHGSSMSPLQSAFAYNGELYVTFAGVFFSMWKFNPQTFSWRKVEPKGKRPGGWSGMMSCCMVGNHVVFFKGYVAKPSVLYMLDLSPTLETLCKLAVLQAGLDRSELPHSIRWDLEAMTSQQIPATNDISDLHIYNYGRVTRHFYSRPTTHF